MRRLEPVFSVDKNCFKICISLRAARGGGGETMDEKRIEQLYRLLERAEKEKDAEAVAALRWAIYTLERR